MMTMMMMMMCDDDEEEEQKMMKAMKQGGRLDECKWLACSGNCAWRGDKHTAMFMRG